MVQVAATEESPTTAEPHPAGGVSLGRDAWRRLRANVMAMAALAYLLTLAVVALLVPALPLQSPYRVNSARVLSPPAWSGWIEEDMPLRDDGAAGNALNDTRVREEFQELRPWDRALLRLRVAVWGDRSMASILGTDELGRDLLSRLLWGARVSLMAGLVATCVSLVIGVTYGSVAGYLGGRVDSWMMRLVDVLYSVPLVFVVIFLITFLGEDRIKQRLGAWGLDRMTVFFLVVGTVSWLTMARVVRGQVISLKHEPFIEAARTLGASQARVIFVHLMPNLLSVVIVYLTLTIPQVMLFEAFLSFLGLGVQAPNVSWGLLANQGFRVISPIKTLWWLIVYPGAAIGTTLLALNFLGDGLRDALDPRLKNR